MQCVYCGSLPLFSTEAELTFTNLQTSLNSQGFRQPLQPTFRKAVIKSQFAGSINPWFAIMSCTLCANFVCGPSKMKKNGSICDPKAFVAHRNTCDIGFKEFGTNIRGNNNSTIYLDHPSLDDSHLTSKKRIPFQHVVNRQHQPNGRDCELSIISHKSSCKEKANADNGKFTGKNGSLSYRNAMKLLMVN